MCFWWWLEGPWFCYCLLGGGWKARCFETACCRVVAGKPCVLLLSVGWWLESQVFCFCLLVWLDSHAWLEMYNHCPYSHVKFKTG